MKRAYFPQARTRSSPKLVRCGVASVKLTALKQLWNAAVRVRWRPFALANNFTAQSIRRRAGAHASLWRTLSSLSVLVQTLPVCHTGRGLSAHGTERHLSADQNFSRPLVLFSDK